jgi:hypothetical protein
MAFIFVSIVPIRHAFRWWRGMEGWAMSLSEVFERVHGRSGILAVPIGLLGIAVTTPARVAPMVCAARSGIGSNAGREGLEAGSA